MNPRDIQVSDYFVRFAPCSPEVLQRVKKSISEIGYDPSEPLILAHGPWTGASVLLDGHTRRRASIELGLENVPVESLYFETRDEALKYLIRRRACRHAFTDGDVLRAVEALDQERGLAAEDRYKVAKESLPSPEVLSEDERRSGARIVEILAIDERTLRLSRIILSCPDDEIRQSVLKGQLSVDEKFLQGSNLSIKEAVLSGDESIEQAYKRVRLYAMKLRSAREKMKQDLCQGQPVKVPTYWLEEGWWPPAKEEIDRCRDLDQKPEGAPPFTLSIPGNLRQRIERLGGSILSHVLAAVEMYLAKFGRNADEGASNQEGHSEERRSGNGSK